MNKKKQTKQKQFFRNDIFLTEKNKQNFEQKSDLPELYASIVLIVEKFKEREKVGNKIWV